MEDLQLRIGFFLLQWLRNLRDVLNALGWIPCICSVMVWMLLLFISPQWAGGVAFTEVFFLVCLVGAVTIADEWDDLKPQIPTHAAVLARIEEIEADALMPIEEWLEKEMKIREETERLVAQRKRIEALIYKEER